jgi:predicted TPR repeat methyltransferase
VVGAEIELPDGGLARATAERWAAESEGLADFLRSGLPMPHALARWGLRLLDAGALSDAVLVFRVALALGTDDPGAWMNLGMAFDREGSLEQAAACLERSLSLFPPQAQTWVLLGMVRSKQGAVADSESAYRSALEHEPTFSMAWQCLGLLKESQRDSAGAIDCFRACVETGALDAAIFANLGKLYYQTGRTAEAGDAFARAVALDGENAHYREMLRKTRFLRDVLDSTPIDQALARYESALGPPPTPADTFSLLEAAVGHLTGFGELAAALRVSEKRVELLPTSSTAKYLRDALKSDSSVVRSPPEYIVETFDAFARGFDAQLVGVLGYNVPENIAAVVRDATPPGHLYDALDAGCGTGLCGPHLRSLARQLVGVDLSPKMLERAAERGVYDALVCDDLPSYLEAAPGRFDLVVGADLFIYFGDLAPVFALVAAALRPGGLFAFNSESLTQDGYRLGPAGRFAHGQSYVRAAWGSAFAQEVFRETTIRLEAGRRMPGNLFLLRRLP